MNDHVKPVLAPDAIDNRAEDGQQHTNDAPTTTYERLVGKIGDVLVDLVTLQVTTCMGKVNSAKLPNIDKGLIPITKAKVIHTRIGLLDGDITTVIDEAFVPEGEIPKLRDFHEQRVTEGGDIVKRNIEAIQELLSMVASFRSDEEQDEE